MNKYILSLLVLIITSCRSETINEKKSVIGKWVIFEITHGEKVIGLDDCSKNENYVFFEDNTYIWNVYGWESVEENKCTVINEGLKGEWNSSDNQLVDLFDKENNISYVMTFNDEFLYFESPSTEDNNNSIIRFVFKRV